MPKAEKGTPKDIAKRIKAKGLQKLKFYCQMCEKQCRDANGFKCHMTSESHLRQMKIFSENAKGIMDRYSREFESCYLTTLRQRHTTKRVNANNVYQEVIQDKQHIHMNSTRWATLSDFVMYLGKTGKCVVDETERGWYVQYIEQDASILERKRKQELRAQAEKEAEIAQAAQMEQQRMEAAKLLDRAGGVLQVQATNMEETDKAITVTLSNDKKKSSNKKSNNAAKASGFLDEEDDEEEEEEPTKPPTIALPEFPKAKAKLPPPPPPSKDNHHKKRQSTGDHKDKDAPQPKRSKPATANLDEEEEDEEQPWLKRDILVRIVTKKLHDGEYFRRKAIVDKVLKDNKYCAEVVVLDKHDDKKETDTILRLDQKDLETVIPREGKKVRILKGPHRGAKAKLLQADKKKYRAQLKLLDDDGTTILEKVDFEDFSALA